MVELHTLVQYAGELLQSGDYQDYCPNGLQVEGKGEINTLISGVSACQALLDRAVEQGADAILVHHGFFWRGEDARVIGMKKRRLATLIKNDVSLIAYHLPLDGHPDLGNNSLLGEKLGLKAHGHFGNGELAQWCELESGISAETLNQRLAEALQREPLHIAGSDRQLKRIGWCTGAAHSYLAEAAAMGLDAFISGEISEPTVHLARELGIDYFAAGHHATERYGVQALGEHLASKFGISHHFIDVDNPV